MPIVNSWIIKGGRIVDPLSGHDETGDLYIHQGVLAPSAKSLPDSTICVQAHGRVVVPGLIDLHVHFREPGDDEAETIASGAMAAARGGFTRVLAMPNTRPPADTPRRISRALTRGLDSGRVRYMASGCITRGRAGKALADLEGMAAAGAAAFTDDGATVADTLLMSQAMQTAAALKLPILDHALDPHLSGEGVMHEGVYSARHGLPGIPSSAETAMVRRDIDLSARTGCAVHIQHVSTRDAAAMLRLARQQGLRVSGEATPHHIALTDADVNPEDARFKMSPPLRSAVDREALIDALADGTLQALATDHAPHRAAEKARGFAHAPFGVVGLETAIGVTYTDLVRTGRLTFLCWLRAWTTGPAAVLGLPSPSLAPGQAADVTILDLNAEWIVRGHQFVSKSANTPFEGRRLTGRATHTFCAGIPTWNEY